MGVRFILGRSGTGKTRHCFDAIVASLRADPLAAGSIYWILPKQATFSAERELVTDSGLNAFCRARVLSFELLGEEVLAACGGAAVPEVSALGRQMLIGHLLRTRQNDLKFFRSVARQPGLAARLDTTFAEFERSGKDPSTVAEVIDQLPADPENPESRLLAEKLGDFHLLYRAYRDALGNERVDPHRRLEQVLTCIGDHRELKNASVYIDGFLEFTDRERRMIVALAKSCPSVEITLLVDPASKTIRDVHHLPDELSLFHRTESQYRLLVLALQEAGVRIGPPLVLKEPRRFINDGTRVIERSLFDGDGEETSDPPRTLKLVEAPDRRSEVDACARRVRAMLRTGDKSLRFRDMAVLVRDIDDYEQLIAASFREHEIPYFVDRRRSAGHHPLIQFTRAVLLIARLNWPHDHAMTLLKSGLAGVEPDDADALENYVLLHRLQESAWWDSEPWTYRRELTRGGRDADELPIETDEEAARMDRLRRALADKVMPFVDLFRREKSPPSVREIVVGLFDVYAKFAVRETIAQWMDAASDANDIEQRGEHGQVWEELTNMFDQLVDLLGDEQVDLADFIEILDVGLEQFDLALTPPRVDQVLVGQVDRTRTTAVDTVFLLGLSEGQFPRVAKEDSVLSDSDRRSLRSKSLDIDPESERRLLDEILLGYIAFTRASRRIIVSRPTSQENKSINPSAFWSRLIRLFEGIEITKEKRESEAGPESIGTPRQLVTALMRWARESDEKADQEQPWARLYQFLSDHKKYDDAIGVMRYKAWRAIGYRNEAKLSPEVAKQLNPAPLHASVTRIETFATCPFKHFARNGLKLETREDDDVTPMDLGNIYHGILERVVTRILQEKHDWPKLEPKLTREFIDQFSAEVGQTLRGELMLSTARNQYMLKRIEKTLERVCATQKAVLSRGMFRPAMAELGFGVEGGRLPAHAIKTPKGHEVKLHGRIDRVDLARGGLAALVIDYKLSDERLNLADVYHGLSLQLLTYLLVLQANGQELFGKKVVPVAAFYAKLLRQVERVPHPDEALDPNDPKFPLKAKPRGVFDARAIRQLDQALETGASEVVQARIKQDGALGNINSSDAADSEAFGALLKYVEKRIGELADRIIAGSIEVRPYRMGLTTPCPHCDYRSVCRFDPGINPYFSLQPMKRSVVLDLIRDNDAGGGERGQ